MSSIDKTSVPSNLPPLSSPFQTFISQMFPLFSKEGKRESDPLANQVELQIQIDTMKTRFEEEVFAWHPHSTYFNLFGFIRNQGAIEASLSSGLYGDGFEDMKNDLKKIFLGRQILTIFDHDKPVEARVGALVALTVVGTPYAAASIVMGVGSLIQHVLSETPLFFVGDLSSEVFSIPFYVIAFLIGVGTGFRTPTVDESLNSAFVVKKQILESHSVEKNKLLEAFKAVLGESIEERKWYKDLLWEINKNKD